MPGAAYAPQLVSISSSCPQHRAAGFSATRARQGGSGSPGRYGGERGEMCERCHPSPGHSGAARAEVLSECARGCQSRCSQRLAGTGHSGRAINHTAALQSPRRSICIPPTPCLGPPALPPGPPTTHSAAKELIRCPTFPSSLSAAQHGKCQQGASHTLASD